MIAQNATLVVHVCYQMCTAVVSNMALSLSVALNGSEPLWPPHLSGRGLWNGSTQIACHLTQTEWYFEWKKLCLFCLSELLFYNEYNVIIIMMMIGNILEATLCQMVAQKSSWKNTKWSNSYVIGIWLHSFDMHCADIKDKRNKLGVQFFRYQQKTTWPTLLMAETF